MLSTCLVTIEVFGRMQCPRLIQYSRVTVSVGTRQQIHLLWEYHLRKNRNWNVSSGFKKRRNLQKLQIFGTCFLLSQNSSKMLQALRRLVSVIFLLPWFSPLTVESFVRRVAGPVEMLLAGLWSVHCPKRNFGGREFQIFHHHYNKDYLFSKRWHHLTKYVILRYGNAVVLLWRLFQLQLQ